MVREIKWTKYLWLILLSFGAFMLEYLSIFVIEVTFLHIDMQDHTIQQRSFHCIIMVFMWAFFIGVLLFSILSFSRKKEQKRQDFPEKLDRNMILWDGVRRYRKSDTRISSWYSRHRSWMMPIAMLLNMTYPSVAFSVFLIRCRWRLSVTCASGSALPFLR